MDVGESGVGLGCLSMEWTEDGLDAVKSSLLLKMGDQLPVEEPGRCKFELTGDIGALRRKIRGVFMLRNSEYPVSSLVH